MKASESPHEQNPEFSIALVNYKTLELTKTCLNLLQQHLGNNRIPIWVVDNGSNDDSVAYLRTLDWIKLIERTPTEGEAGHIAHGKALDMILDSVDTDYLFLLHTDTFIFDKEVFAMMLNKCTKKPNTIAVGCTEQIDRGIIRTAWRFTSRVFKHYFRRLKIALHLPSKTPKAYRETHLKSFCTLWNSKLIKQHGLHFLMDNRVPGYTLQDRTTELGYNIEFISAHKLFKYLDHIQSGTVAATGGYSPTHRRTKMYNEITKRLSDAQAK